MTLRTGGSFGHFLSYALGSNMEKEMDVRTPLEPAPAVENTCGKFDTALYEIA